MNKNSLILVNAEILPDVFTKVLTVKQLLSDGVSPNVSAAVKQVGLSRSAYYKYKNFVFKYEQNPTTFANLTAILSDKPGVFSALAAKLYEQGGNIITVNQSTPVDGTAKVTMSIGTDNILKSLNDLIRELKDIKGVINIKAD